MIPRGNCGKALEEGNEVRRDGRQGVVVLLEVQRHAPHAVKIVHSVSVYSK